MPRRIDVRSEFIREARAQGLEVRGVLSDGVVVALGEQELAVNLENLSRNVARDGDPGEIQRFVAVLRDSLEPLPAWSEARRGIRYAAEPSCQEFGDALRELVTETVARVLVYVDSEEQSIRWLTPGDVREWGVSVEDVDRAARENMVELLSSTELDIESVDHHRLGLFDTISPLKAALIFSPNLKEVVAPQLGWPIYAVVPCRDFAYVFPTRDRDLLPRLGRVVVQEYTTSGYPITTEVLEISDAGIKAIGAFPVRQ